MAKCEPGCTCNRHKVYYRGGSKKGRTLSQEARQNIAEGAKTREYTDEQKLHLSEQMKSRHKDPEWEAKRIAAIRAADMTCEPGCTCGRHSEETRQKVSEAHFGLNHTDKTKQQIGLAMQRYWEEMTPEEREALMAKRSEGLKKSWAKEKAEGRVRQTGGYLCSRHELSLIPYMEKLGYRHNTTRWVGRRVPDFIDEEGKRIFEYFGSYWHPRPEEEDEVADYYALYGYTCTVLWEYDLFQWLSDHQELVEAEEHDEAWRSAKVNNGYHKPPQE